ncbi:MAG: hypothetical protein JNL42_03760 [Anaerolineae bacterium]|nr:hypothetical protein [Anaerolineae bacterium]
MNSYRETDAHQRAKWAILNGCAQAGYTPQSEVIGGDWRADVLAARGGVRVAFEVQWSPQKLRETLLRQERYARDGVRGCWFFRQPPSALRAAEDPAARRDLPLFHLFANADGSFVVRLSGRLTPLGSFVAALLGGQVRFCEEAVSTEAQEAAFEFYPLRCDACGRVGHVHRLKPPILARCGHRAALDQDWALFATRGELLTAAHQAAANDPALTLARFSEVGGGASAACPHCGAAYPERRIALAGYGEQPVRTLTAEVRLRRPLRLRSAHWCFPVEGEPCCPPGG